MENLKLKSIFTILIIILIYNEMLTKILIQYIIIVSNQYCYRTTWGRFGFDGGNDGFGKRVEVSMFPPKSNMH